MKPNASLSDSSTRSTVWRVAGDLVAILEALSQAVPYSRIGDHMTTPFLRRPLRGRSFRPRYPDPCGRGRDGGLRKAAEQFEAVILRQLLASMRQASSVTT